MIWNLEFGALALDPRLREDDDALLFPLLIPSFLRRQEPRVADPGAFALDPSFRWHDKGKKNKKNPQTWPRFSGNPIQSGDSEGKNPQKCGHILINGCLSRERLELGSVLGADACGPMLPCITETAQDFLRMQVDGGAIGAKQRDGAIFMAANGQ